MTTSDPISVPNLPRRDNDPRINQFLSSLVVNHHVVIKLEDEPDEDGNCVIEVTHGDPEVIEAVAKEIAER